MVANHWFHQCIKAIVHCLLGVHKLPSIQHVHIVNLCIKKKCSIQTSFTMSKVKVMKFHQTVMAIIGLYPYPLTESKYKAPNLISPYVMCPCLGGSIVLSALYAYQGSEVLSFVLDAVIIFIGESQALAVYLNMRQKIDMIGNLNQKLQDIVDQGISHKLIFQPQIKLKVQFYRFKKNQDQTKGNWLQFIGMPNKNLNNLPKHWPHS